MRNHFKIFAYWENINGVFLPAYIKKCLEKLNTLCVDYEVTLLTPENVDFYLKGTDLNPNWRNLSSIAHRVDCIRVAVMNKYGGLWVDADTVFLKQPKEVFYKMNGSDLMYIKWDDGRVLNGYFLCKAGSPIMEEWLNKINLKLCNLSKEFTWTAFGETILTPLVDKYEDTCTEIDRSIFLPINIDRIPNIFFEDIDYKAFIKENTVTVGLNHSYFCNYYPDFILEDEEKIVTGDKIINQLMRVIS